MKNYKHHQYFRDKDLLVSTHQIRYIEFMDRRLLEAARKIEAAVELSHVWELFTATINKLGLDNALYMTIADEPPLDPIVMSTLPEDWPAAEFEHPKFAEPFLTYCCATFEISKVGVEFIEDHADYIDEPVRDYVAKFSSFNWLSGLGIPCRLVGTGRHGGFIVGSNLSSFAFERKFLPIEADLRSFCLIVHRRIELICSGAKVLSKSKRLSAREHQTLNLIAKGIKPKQIAHQLEISEASVRLYLKNAKAKLGVETKDEAIAVFVSQNG